MTKIPPIRYKCPQCGYQTRQELTSLICPEPGCGYTLQDMNLPLYSQKGIWDEQAFYDLPCVMAHEYNRLYTLSLSNNTYGVFLKLKDVIEVTIKFVVLVSCAWGKEHNVTGREDGYEKNIAQERMSLGHWVNILNEVKNFYAIKKNTEEGLPSELWVLLEKVNKWVNNNRLVNWRNEKLGHGVIAFEDDADFQQDICEKIRIITDFYRTNMHYFSAIQMYSADSELSGYQSARNLDAASAPCSIKIHSDYFSASPFIIHLDHGIYFYDEIIRKRQMRLLCYPLGKVKLQADDYTSRLASLHNNDEYLKDASLNSDFLTKAENDFLAKLGCVDAYVEPEYLTNWLRSQVEGCSKGVFLLEMERGCGKTFYSEKLNRRFTTPQEITDDLDVRTYHLFRTQTGGINEFIAGIESEWNQAYEKDPGADLVRSIHIEYDPENDECNGLALASYLKRIREYTSQSNSRQRKKAIMLVLDGMDEISERNSKIWSFIPRADQLTDGVYILLTGRNRLTDNLPESYINRIESLCIPTSCIKQVTSNSKDNIIVLRRFMRNKSISNITYDNVEKLIEMSGGKFISLAMLCNYLVIGGIDDTLTGDIKHISKGYLCMLEKKYGDSRKGTFQLILSIILVLSRFEALSLQEIADLSLMGDIRFELLDILSDIMPLLSVERGYSSENGLQSDNNRYRIANEDIMEAVEEYLGPSLTEVITELHTTITNELTGDNNHEGTEYSEGYLALISHCYDLYNLYNIQVDWHPCDIEHFYNFAFNYRKVDKYNAGLINVRFVNTLRQNFHIAQLMSVKDLDSIHNVIMESCQLLIEQLTERYLYEEKTSVLEYIKNYLDNSSEASKEELLMVYSELGIVYEVLGHPLTEQILKKALNFAIPLAKKNRDSFIPTQIGILQGLGTYYMNTNRLAEAEEKYKEALEVYKKFASKNIRMQAKIVSIQLLQAHLLIMRGKASQAEDYYHKVRSFCIKQKDRGNTQHLPTLAHCDNELADLLRVETKYDEAEQYFKESIEIYEALIKNGHSHLEIALANTKHNYAILFRERKEYDNAIVLYMEALETYEKHAQISPAVYEVEAADTIMNLGNAYRDISKYNEAEQYYIHALDIYKKYYIFNADEYDIRYANVCINYAQLLQTFMGKLIKAGELFKEAEKIYEKRYSLSPSAHGNNYYIIVINQTLNTLLRNGYKCLDSFEAFQKMVKITNDKNIPFPTDYSVDKQQAEMVLKSFMEMNVPNFHFSEDAMTTKNGWNPEIADEIKRLMQTSTTRSDVPSTILQQLRGKWLDRTEFKPGLQAIKQSYRGFKKRHQSIRITNGPSASVCENAENLMKTGEYIRANSIILEAVQSSKTLSVRTAFTWFSVLAVSGDIKDASNLVDILATAVDRGIIVHDQHMEKLSITRQIMFICIENMMGHDIIDFLRVLSRSPYTYKLSIEDLDTKPNEGYYIPLIRFIQRHFPGALEDAVFKFFNAN